VSSGTTGANQSRHLISDLSIYKKSFTATFELFYGNIQNYCILALLPGYLERQGSSLVYMIRSLIEQTGNPDSGFYLRNYMELGEKLCQFRKDEQKILLFGVSHALLDFAEYFDSSLVGTIVMETGGMKGRKKEITREELHSRLCKHFDLQVIHSEYGMTELLSQAYSKGKGIFFTPPWMKVVIRDVYDPFHYLPRGRTGGINIIDLANVNSVSFIETKDLGRLNSDGGFEILGRYDNSDLRGCSLLLEE
ncbi:MAG: acyltransferase, partial [Bacteroidales bacterium]